MLRLITGFFKRLTAGWGDAEWFYYNASGLDPKIPAMDRWEARLSDKAKPPETPQEELLPQRTYSVILRDKFGLTGEDMAFTTTDLGKAQAVFDQFERELRTRSSGDFWHGMIKNRRLDFFHKLKPQEDLEGTGDIDEEQAREKFLR